MSEEYQNKNYAILKKDADSPQLNWLHDGQKN